MFDQNKGEEQLLAEMEWIKRQRQSKLFQGSEEHYYHLFRDSAVGMVVVTPDGRITQSNKAFCDLLGYSEPELFGKTLLSMRHPDDCETTSKTSMQSFAGGIRVQHIDQCYLHKSGQLVWGKVSTIVICDVEGRPSYAIVQVSDITERKQAEAALKKAHDELEAQVQERTVELVTANESLDIFRKFVEASREGFGMSDFEGRIVYVNATLCRMLGEETPENVIGNNVAAYYSEEYLQRRKAEMIPALLQSGYWQAEQPFMPRHGKPIQTLQSTFLIRDEQGNPFRIAVVISDITERKQAEHALRKSNDELQAIYDGMVDGLLIADVETKRFVRGNAAICRMLGYSMEELLSMSVKDIHPANDLPAILKTFQAQAAGQIAINENAPVLRKDGSVFYADIGTNRIIFDHRPYLIGFFRDITERKQAQEARQKEHRTLKHLLLSSDHERQMIAYEIHDGLAQYLAGAIMQFQVFSHLKDTEPVLAAEAHDAGVAMVRKAHFEARRLIAGVRPPVLDEAGVVEAIFHLINEKKRENGRQIEFRHNVQFGRLVPILENAIYRICQEGLSNACQHSQSPQVLASLFQQHDRIRIEIRDWGIGFNPNNVREGNYGLISIRERARLLGGSYRLQSAAGKGTRIVVELPLVERESQGENREDRPQCI